MQVKSRVFLSGFFVGLFQFMRVALKIFYQTILKKLRESSLIASLNEYFLIVIFVFLVNFVFIFWIYKLVAVGNFKCQILHPFY